MSPCELTMSITALANGMADMYSEEDLEFLIAVFEQLGDTLATILVHRARCEHHKECFFDEK